jgi:microcystin-dependent protein
MSNVTDKVGLQQLKFADGSTGQFLSTDGGGNFSFQTIDVSTASIGGDLTGTVSNAQIGNNTIGIPQLLISDGSSGQVLQTNGAGVMSFVTPANAAGASVGGDITGTVANAQIVSSAVGTTELASNAVTTVKITDLNVTAVKLAANSVATDKIVDANVTDVKIAGMSASKLTGALPAISGAALTGLAAGVATGIIAIWSGSIASIPAGWVICDGTNSTPDLRDRFVIGAGNGQAVNATGGSTSTAGATLSIAQLAAHTHQYNATNTRSQGGDNAAQSAIHASTATSSTGGGATHTHTGTLPPFFALAYIMKT